MNDKPNAEFEEWFSNQDMPIDISLFRNEDGTFIPKSSVTPLLKAGALFAWVARDATIAEQKEPKE